MNAIGPIAKKRLIAVDSWETAIHRLIHPQIQDWQEGALLNSAIWIVAPNRPMLEGIKFSLLQEKAFVNLHTFTPSALRERLIKDLPCSETQNCPAKPADLHLALKLALAKDMSPKAQAVKLDVEHWATQLKQLLKTGIAEESIEDPWLRTLAQKQTSFLKQADLVYPHLFDWEKLKHQKVQERLPFKLICIGFDLKGSDLFPLLARAALLSEEALILLTQDTTDAALIGSWEEILQEPIEIFPEETLCPKYYHITPSAKHPHDIIDTLLATLQHELKGQNKNEHIIISAEDPALLRELAAQLEWLNIPFYDTTGAPLHTKGKKELFFEWLHFQEKRTLSAALDFARCLEKHSLLPDKHTAVLLSRSWEPLLGILQTEALPPIFAYLEKTQKQKPTHTREALLSFFKAWPLLPKKIEIAAFEGKLKTLPQEIWPDSLSFYGLQAWSQPIIDPIDTSYLLQYLRQSLLHSSHSRSHFGTHSWASIWILPLDLALGIPADRRFLLEGERTRKAFFDLEAPFIYKLNQEAICTGSQGEGHDIFVFGKSPLLTPREEEKLHIQKRSHFLRTATSASYFIGQNIESLESISWQELSVCVRQSALNWRMKPLLDVSAIQQAYQERRNPQTPFGPYDYSCPTTMRPLPSLSCQNWEILMQHPVAIWYKNILHTESLFFPNSIKARFKQKGIWVHEWIQQDNNPKSLHSWKNSIYSQAQAVRASVEGSFFESEQALPGLWRYTWETALSLALEFLESMQGMALEFPHIKQEISIPGTQTLQLPGGGYLQITGRMDAVLSAENWSFTNTKEALPALWIVDFKTYPFRPITQASLNRGTGLQLALYAMALQALGAKQVRASILSPSAGKNKPIGIDTDLLASCDGLWKSMERIANQGIFGDRAQNLFGNPQRSSYPIATLAVDPSILEMKWQLTHPELS